MTEVTVEQPAMQQPNILLVQVDQLMAGALRVHGGHAIAPNLDALAEGGVVFERAYCAAPLCAPSRASMMTGLLPSRCGVYDNAAELSATIPTVAHHLRLAGYATCLVGKMHFPGPDQLHGFEERLTTDVYPASVGDAPDFEGPIDQVHWEMTPVLEAGPVVATFQTDYDDEVAFVARRRLIDHARYADKPLFMVASFSHPHEPFDPPTEHWLRYEGLEIPPPALPTAPEDLDDPCTERLRKLLHLDEADLSDAVVARARRAYHASISFVDDKLGEIIRTLEQTGLRENTIVVFTSDHGEMLGERGLWHKVTMYEDAVRVPLIVNAPSRFHPGEVPSPVSLLDLLPTMLDWAVVDVELPEPLDGVSLSPLLSGERPAGRVIASELLGEGGATAPVIMLRDERFKFIRSPGDPDLLFDLLNDPLETKNLVGSTDQLQVLEGFQERLQDRWDLTALDSAIRLSQRRRRVVGAALRLGTVQHWEWQPPSVGEGRNYHGDSWHEYYALIRDARLRERG